MKNDYDVRLADLTNGLSAVVSENLDEGNCGDFPTIIKDTLWSTNEGLIVTPLYGLNIPVLARYDTFGDESGASYKVGALTVFNRQFFEDPTGSFVKLEQGTPREHYMFEHVTDGLGEYVSTIDFDEFDKTGKYGKHDLLVLETIGLDKSPYEVVVLEHVNKVLEVYNAAKCLPALSESLMCLRESVIDYR